MGACACNVGFGNTGKANCEPIQDVTAKLIFVRTFADDGTKNAIPVGTVVDDAFIEARINEVDVSKRWYPSRRLVAVEDVRGDNATESIDGVDYITDKGQRTFVGFSPKTDAVYLGKISQGECGQFSVFIVDKSNRIIGEESEDGLNLYPVAIEEGTYYTRLVKTTQSTVQKTEIGFTFSILSNDEDLRLTQATGDLLGSTGLLDVNATNSGESTVGFVSALALDYGYFGSEIPVVGWVLADFELYNVTQDVAVVITSVTETPDGTYTFVIPAQTAADELTLKGVKTGFELTSTIQIP